MLSRLGGRLSPLCACARPAVFGTGFWSHKQDTTHQKGCQSPILFFLGHFC